MGVVCVPEAILEKLEPMLLCLTHKLSSDDPSENFFAGPSYWTSD